MTPAGVQMTFCNVITQGKPLDTPGYYGHSTLE